MTPEERLTRIERNPDTFGARVEAFSVWVEKAIEDHEKRLHAQPLPIQAMLEFQSVLMDSQNKTWHAVKTLTDNIEKLVRGLQAGDGNREEDS